MRAYLSDRRTGEILEVLEYEKLTSDIFKRMCTDAMDYLQDAMKTYEGKQYGAEFRWAIGKKFLECYSGGDGYWSRLELVNSDRDRCCLLRDRF